MISTQISIIYHKKFLMEDDEEWSIIKDYIIWVMRFFLYFFILLLWHNKKIYWRYFIFIYFFINSLVPISAQPNICSNSTSLLK